jgi:type 2 lantibiotic biosynthesis protein LanM
LDDEFLDTAVDACLAEGAKVFGGFYRPFVTDCARRLAQWEAEWGQDPLGGVDWRRVTPPLLGALMNELHRHGIRALISAFRAQRNEPGARGYADFHAWVGGERGREHVLGAFPELDRLLHLATDHCLRNTEEVLAAAGRDRPALAGALGADGRVVRVQPGLGDSHRGGRTVCVVRWDNGATTVYKPQRRSCHTLLRALQGILDPDGSFFGPLCPPALVRDTHMWQGFVAHSDIRAPGEDADTAAARYFRRFGRSSALLSMLGANDLHHENVIATADGPVVIDLETLVSLPELRGEGNLSALWRDIEASPLNTLLFPVRTRGGAIDVDLSALGTVRPAESQRLRSYTVVDAGTDDIRFDALPAAVQPGGANVAAVDGEVVDPRVWVDHITAGYGEARTLLERHRAAVEEAASDGDWSVRQILRPTMLYARFLEASTHPAYLADKAARAALFDKLPHRHRGVDPDLGAQVARAETAALVDLDVPFFEVDADSRDLSVNGTAECVGQAVATTPREALRARIGAFFDRPPGRDPAYIRSSLSSSVDDAWDTDTRRGRRAGLPGALPALTDVRSWHASLADLVVGDSDHPSWMTPRLFGAGLRLDAANTLMYEGGGLLVYLAQAAAAGQATGVDPGAIYAGAAQEAVPGTPFPLGASPFTGLLSTRVTGLELRSRGVALGVPLPFPTLPDTTGLVVEEMSDEDFDYINGFGGYLVYRAAHGDTDPGGPRPAELDPEPLLRRLIEIDGPPDTYDGGGLGLAHGRFGRIAAIASQVAAGTDTDGRARDHLERFAAAYLRERWSDEALGDRKARAGWCRGYAGVAYAAAEALTRVGYGAADVRRALEPEIDQVVASDLTPDLSLCHGAAGRVAMLCVLADRLRWPQLRDEAARLNTAFLDRYGEHGWHSGIGAAPELPGFMLGLSGWHYVQLMLADPAVRLPLCLGGS